MAEANSFFKPTETREQLGSKLERAKWERPVLYKIMANEAEMDGGTRQQNGNHNS